MSDIEEVDPEHNVTYRGARIFNAMMEHLFVDKGIADAQNVMLTGSSAGGLTTILHCDKFRASFPESTRVKCVSDSGFFIRGEELIGVELREERFFNVVSVHGLANSLPKACTAKMNPALCLFSENLVNNVQTPLFLVESAFDQYQIQHMIPETNEWENCTDEKNKLATCTWAHMKIMKDFQATFIGTLKTSVANSSSIGYYVHSCYLHIHVRKRKTWQCSSLAGNNLLAYKSIGEAVGEWYLNQSVFQEVDMVNDLPRICTGALTDPAFDQQCMQLLHHA